MAEKEFTGIWWKVQEEIETLTREDIEDLVNTGQLTWWEKKKAKMEADKVAEEKVDAQEEAPVENTEDNETR